MPALDTRACVHGRPFPRKDTCSWPADLCELIHLAEKLPSTEGGLGLTCRTPGLERIIMRLSRSAQRCSTGCYERALVVPLCGGSLLAPRSEAPSIRVAAGPAGPGPNSTASGVQSQHGTRQPWVPPTRVVPIDPEVFKAGARVSSHPRKLACYAQDRIARTDVACVC